MNRLSFFALLPLALLALACSKEKVAGTAGDVAVAAQRAAENIQARLSGEGPIGPRVTHEEIERQRFDIEWQGLRSFREAARRRAAVEYRKRLAALQQQQRQARLRFISEPKFFEKLNEESLAAIDTLPIRVPIRGDVAGPSVLRAQILLDRVMYSPGVIDGRWGKNTAIAVYWFQRENDLDTTGEIDEATFRALARIASFPPAVVQRTLTDDDLKGPYTRIPEDVYGQAELDCLCYESLSERLAERFHTTPELVRLLNSGVDLDGVQAGQTLRVPNIRPPLGEGGPVDLQRILVSVQGNYLHGFDASGRLLLHAPTTVGSKYDPSPDETLKIVGIAHNPNFHYQPKLFHEVPDTEPEARLKPGPNSPVGVVWMALSKPHYGIHGTSDPDSIGYVSSHGCIRLTNWDAHDLSHRVREGVMVEFLDTRTGG